MRIGLISDTHNEHRNLDLALSRFRQDGITTILHAGDITRPPVLHKMEGFDVWIARGNMDRAPDLITEATTLFGKGHFLALHDITMADKHIALLHGDQWNTWSKLIQSHHYDYVISGHTHKSNDERFGRTRAINPGALGSNRIERPGYAVLNLETDTLEFIRLP